MTSTIIICFVLTLLSILTINSYTATKIEQQTTLDNVVNASIKSMELDEVVNESNYEQMIGNLNQLIVMQSDTKGTVEVKIVDANTQEGLLDIEVTKTYNWLGFKKKVVARRVIIMDEYDHPPATPVKIKFVYNDASGNIVIWREDDTFSGALLRRPKNPKKQGYKFMGWSMVSATGTPVSDDEWQNFVIPEDITAIRFHAVFQEITQ